MRRPSPSSRRYMLVVVAVVRGRRPHSSRGPLLSPSAPTRIFGPLPVRRGDNRRSPQQKSGGGWHCRRSRSSIGSPVSASVASFGKWLYGAESLRFAPVSVTPNIALFRCVR